MRSGLLLTMAATILVASSIVACENLDARCGPQQRLAVPVGAADMDSLEQIAAAVSADNAGRPGIWLIDADEATGTVAVGVMDRTASTCDRLHATYGPLLDILGPPDRP